MWQSMKEKLGWSRKEDQPGTRLVVSHPYTRTPQDPSPFVTNRITNTKYTLWSFIPLNLWQQFSQAMNKYFLLIAILQLWSTITPVSPITTWGPLAVIFAISGLKEAIDDTRRYRSDCQANERLVSVLRDGHRRSIQSQDLLVGDIIFCQEDEEFPADIVLLKSSETKTGSCYIQTSNIDGETNLKQRFSALKDYTHQLDEADMMDLHITIECAHPNKNIYNYDSTLKLPNNWSDQIKKTRGYHQSSSSSSSSSATETSFPLTGDNLLLQATYLRNTAWIYGLVVYTGNETKVGCNKSIPLQKYTKLDEKINKVTILVFMVQILLIVIWGFLGYHMERIHKNDAEASNYEGGFWYLHFTTADDESFITPFVIPLRFLLLASMMIPISLKVSLDLIKLYYSLLINWDLDLYDASRDLPAKATNTSIAENLGQVSYVLSDKTGTLTENVMVFRKMALRTKDGGGEKKYGEFDDHAARRLSHQHKHSRSTRSISNSSNSGSSNLGMNDILTDPNLLHDIHDRSEDLIHLLKFMALCNTVVPSWTGDVPGATQKEGHNLAKTQAKNINIHASSPLSDSSLNSNGSKSAKLSLEMTPSHELSGGGGSNSKKNPRLAGLGPSLLNINPDTSFGVTSSAENTATGSKDAATVAVMPSSSVPTTSNLHSSGLDQAVFDSASDVNTNKPKTKKAASVAVSKSSAAKKSKQKQGEEAASLLRGGGHLQSDDDSIDVASETEEFTPSSSFTINQPSVDRLTSYTTSSSSGASAISLQRQSSLSLLQHFHQHHSSHHLLGQPSSLVHYASSSPDELSLVEFASSVGVKLIEKEGNVLRVIVQPKVHSQVPVSSGSQDLDLLPDANSHPPHARRMPSTSAIGSAITAKSMSGHLEEWELLHVLEFSSERKRMSVVIRQLTTVSTGGTTAPPTSQIYLFTKGADDVIFARLGSGATTASSGSAIPSATDAAAAASQSASNFRSILDSYASCGLRTLCFAERRISQSEYDSWLVKLQAAHLDIHHREERLSETYELLERDLELIGCTGIEDKLQEGVKETIEELREANIKVWMLTGDKVVTAIEISKSCALYKPKKGGASSNGTDRSDSVSSGASTGSSSASIDGDVLYSIEGVTPQAIRASLDSVLRQAFNPHAAPHAFCLIIDGSTLGTLLSPQVEARFALVALHAVSVICARTTPAQKASMVSLVKKYSSRLGVGNKSTSADYFSSTSPAKMSYHQNEHIQAMLRGEPYADDSVHLCSLFSNLFRSTDEVVLAIGDGGNDVSMIQVSDVGIGIIGKEGLQASRAADYSFSRFEYLKKLLLCHGRYAYNRTAFVAQYCFFKSMLICLVQLFFAFVSNWSGASYFDSYSLVTYNLFYTSLPTLLFVFEKDLSERVLLLNPRLYTTSQFGENLTTSTFLGWCGRALMQALFLIAFALATHHGEVSAEAFGFSGQISNALVIYTACVLIHPITIYLECTYITKVHHLVLGGTLALFLALNCLLAVLSPAMDLWHVYLVLLRDGEYYLRVLVLTTLCCIPVVAFKYVQTRYYPSTTQRAHESELAYAKEHPEFVYGANGRPSSASDVDTSYHRAP